MAKRRTRTTRADGFDPYEPQRHMNGRKSHLAAAINQNIHDKPWMGPVWAVVLFVLFFFAVVMMFAK